MSNSTQLRSRFGRQSSWLLLILFSAWCVACSATTATRDRIAATNILSQLKNGKPVSLENMTIDGDLDFTSLPASRETETISRAYITGPVFFRNCIFAGKVLAFREDKTKITVCRFDRNLTFSECTFMGETNWQGMSIAGLANFSRSHFNQLVSFENVRFGAEAFFDDTIFAQEARFQQAVFAKRANFWHSVWAGVVYFQGAIFREDTQFNLAEFRANLDFSLCTTDGQLNFNYAQFTGKSIFDNCRFHGVVDFNNATLPEATLRDVIFDTKASFIDIKSQSISFENAVFLSQRPTIKLINSKPDAVNLSGATVVLSGTVLLK
jgi:uncharacterized protein YjbI with pentapeptide repeats